jgi:hypothetical protein
VKQLTETVSVSLFTIVEAADVEKKKPLKARGVFAVCDEATKNGRRYSENLWKSNIARLKESIARRRLVGELDHPADGKTLLQRSSHLITDLAIESRDGKRVVVGTFEVLNTSRGKDLKALIEGGVEVGVSSRGSGSVKARQDGTEDVQESDFRLYTFDTVFDPAADIAYPEVTEATINAGYLDIDHVAGEQAASILEGIDLKALAQRAVDGARTKLASELVEATTAIREELLTEARKGYVTVGLMESAVALVKVAERTEADAKVAELKAALDAAVARAEAAETAAKAARAEATGAVPSEKVTKLTALVDGLTRTLQFERAIAKLDDPDAARAAVGDVAKMDPELAAAKLGEHIAKLGEREVDRLSKQAVEQRTKAEKADAEATDAKSRCSLATKRAEKAEAKAHGLQRAVQLLAKSKNIHVEHLISGLSLVESVQAADTIIDGSNVLRLNGEGRVATAIREATENLKRTRQPEVVTEAAPVDGSKPIAQLAGIPMDELRRRADGR